MPFAINEATRFISPTKVLEYMAAELPIVSTRSRTWWDPTAGWWRSPTAPMHSGRPAPPRLALAPSDREAKAAAMREQVARGLVWSARPRRWRPCSTPRLCQAAQGDEEAASAQVARPALA
ncbi:hypothetical protein [Massilia haematophila]|uniref:Uncharacterized protein n=1 Tax=Massilia haematophila TaxID=457923 RepID=A0ABV7PBZ0_9BURK